MNKRTIEWINLVATNESTEITTNFYRCELERYEWLNEWANQRIAWSEMKSVTVSYETLEINHFPRYNHKMFSFLRWEKWERNGNCDYVHTRVRESESLTLYNMRLQQL